MSIITLTLTLYMYKSNKTIIEHLPDFITYCSTKGLSPATQENYKRFLKRFIDWLYYKNFENLFPHELNEKHIADYKNYLLSPTLNRNTGKFLKTNTQHYYLVVLRGLLDYLGDKGILSLASSKITLPRAYKCLKNDICLDRKDVERILSAPITENVIGLRDRAILNVIISTGYKVHRICNLNRDCLRELPENIYPCINEYLKERLDKIEALFISYRGIKRIDQRMTTMML